MSDTRFKPGPDPRRSRGRPPGAAAVRRAIARRIDGELVDQAAERVVAAARAGDPAAAGVLLLLVGRDK